MKQQFGQVDRHGRSGAIDRHDREDILQYAALRLWKMVNRRSYPEFENEAHLNAWSSVAVYRWLCQAYQDMPHRAEEVVDYAHAHTVWGKPQVFSQRASEDEIFLRELPSAVLSRVRRTCRLPVQDYPAIGYIANQLVQGRKPIQYYMTSALRIARPRIHFLIDYVTVRVRWALYRIFMEDMGGVIAHPSMQAFSRVR
jgi:hypothetical protein